MLHSTIPANASHATEVLVIGAGASGLSVARDACLRGFRVLVLERAGIASGATGRYHGLLHSGARYICQDVAAAQACAHENQLLRRLIPDAICDTGGYMVSTPADPPAYAEQFWLASQQHGLPIQEVPLSTLYRNTPLLNPHIQRAFATADATCDSFVASQLLAADIQQRGVELRYHWAVRQVVVEAGRARAVIAENLRSGETQTITAEWVLNCAGAWVGQVAQRAGCPIPLVAGKGVLLAFHTRLVQQVINRCKPPSDGDIIVPIGSVSVLGTTDSAVPDPDQTTVTAAEVEHLLTLGEQLLPTLRHYRVLRAWAGVRALLAEPNTLDNRALTRSHSVLDHAERDGVAGLLSLIGGKLTTMRQMAADMLDRVCAAQPQPVACQTADTPLLPPDQTRFFIPATANPRPDCSNDPILCECEQLPESQVQHYLDTHPTAILADLRRSTRLALGGCQGGSCIYRAAGLLAHTQSLPAPQARQQLQDLLQTHWPGQQAVLWGQTLQQTAQNLQLYQELLGLTPDV